MFNYQRLKKKYDSLYNKTLEENKEILIESFIEYYGERHRDTIVSRFNEIVFVYFISWDHFSNIEKIFNSDSFQKKYIKINAFEDIKKFLKYQKKTSDAFENYFVGSSNKKVLKEKFIDDITSIEDVLKNQVFKKTYPCFFCATLKKQSYRVVCFPILIITELQLIHELNHAITDSSMIINKKVDKYHYIDKSGLQVGKENRDINELLNDRASLDIYMIFKRRGGNIDKLNLVYFQNGYIKNLYLIDLFYYKFKEIIKESLITMNKNYLVQMVGKDNYEELVNIIDKYYIADISSSPDEEASRQVLEEVNEKMHNKVTNTERLTKEDLTKYYSKLEQEGKKVRILNDLPEYSEEEKNNFHL